MGFKDIWSVVGLEVLPGHTFGLVGMANTATTFAVLWIVEKYGEEKVLLRDAATCPQSN